MKPKIPDVLASLDAIFAKLLEGVRPPVLPGLQGYYAEIDYFKKTLRNPVNIFLNQSNHGR
jgi:hypothetical protein